MFTSNLKWLKGAEVDLEFILSKKNLKSLLLHSSKSNLILKLYSKKYASRSIAGEGVDVDGMLF